MPEKLWVQPVSMGLFGEKTAITTMYSPSARMVDIGCENRSRTFGKKDPVPWNSSSAIKRGTGRNQLKVIVIGNSITLIANDTVLTTVKGSSFGPGKIGLVGGSFDDTDVEVQFDNLMIYDFSL